MNLKDSHRSGGSTPEHRDQIHFNRPPSVQYPSKVHEHSAWKTTPSRYSYRTLSLNRTVVSHTILGDVPIAKDQPITSQNVTQERQTTGDR